MNRIVDAWLQEAEPPGLLDSNSVPAREPVRLDEPIHLLQCYGIRLETLELNRVHPGHDVQGCHRRIQGQNIDVRAAIDLRRVDQEEELASYVVRVIEDERVDLDEILLAGAPAQTEFSIRNVARLLSPDALEIQGTRLPRHQETEVPRGNTFGQKA